MAGSLEGAAALDRGAQGRRMKILVTYATGFGSTAEVAEAIAVCLRERDEVVVQPVHEVLSVRPYDAVVLGSPVRAGRWLRSATGFLANWESELAQKAVAYFALCLMARDEIAVVALLKPKSEMISAPARVLKIRI